MSDDFLNADGVRPNWLTGKEYSQQYKDLARTWKALPMYADATKTKEILQSLENNQITLIVAGTGSGKTLFVPKYAVKLLTAKEPESSERVVITIPKRVAVEVAARFSASTLNVQLGQEVDYSYRGKGASRDAKLLYTTDGSLLAGLLHGDPLMTKYRTVILDEAHERPVPTDILLYFLRDVVRQRPEFRLVIMSATIDPSIYVDYFRGIAPVNVVSASGATPWPIQHMFLPPGSTGINVKKPLEAVLLQVVELLDKTKGGDILAFVPRVMDTAMGCHALQDPRHARLMKGVLCIALHAKTAPEDAELATDRTPEQILEKLGYSRRVIFASPVAESSMTFKGLVYVVDSGMEVQVAWDAPTHATRIDVGYTTQGQIQQRVGRIGRTGPGVAYHLYTEAQLASLPKLPQPNISKTELSDQFLLICSHFTVGQAVRTFAGLLTPPSPAQVADAMSYLHFYGLISVNDKPFNKIPYRQLQVSYEGLQGCDGEITSLGRVLLKVPDLSPDSALLLVWGSVFGCSTDMRLLACIMETIATSGVRGLWKGDGLSAAQKGRVVDPSSDHVTLMNVYRTLYLSNDRAGLSSQWRKVASQIGKFYHLDLDEVEREHLLKNARIPGLSPVKNAILAARCFNLVCLLQAQGMVRNMYPLLRMQGRATTLFGGKTMRGRYAVYETLTITSKGADFQVITAFPEIKGAIQGVEQDCAKEEKRGHAKVSRKPRH